MNVQLFKDYRIRITGEVTFIMFSIFIETTKEDLISEWCFERFRVG